MKRLLLLTIMAMLAAGVVTAQDSPEYRLMKSVLSANENGVRSTLAEGADVDSLYLVHGVAWGPYDTPLADLEFELIDPNRFALANNMNAEVWPLLMGACESGNPEIMRILIQAGADANYNRGEILSRAIDENQADMLAAALEGSLNDESRSSAWYSAFKAAKERDVTEVIEMLLDAGFDPNETIRKEQTVLEIACTYEIGDEIINLLISRGAEFSFESPLLGTWLSPTLNNVPGSPAKMVYRPDGTGVIFNRTDDTRPMNEFTYEFRHQDKEQSVYKIIQTYDPGNYWYVMTYVQTLGDATMLYWVAWGQNVETFPEWGQSTPVVWNGVLEN